jgi:hypothetical protein
VQNDIKINPYEIQQLQIPPPNTMTTKLKGGEYYNDITTPPWLETLTIKMVIGDIIVEFYNLIKIRYPHLLTIFYQLFCSHRVKDLTTPR